MKNKIVWTVVLLISHTLFFVGGDIRGKYLAAHYVRMDFEMADAAVVLGQYSVARDIAVNIKAGKYDDAKCSADLEASSKLDDLKSCLSKQKCRLSIEKRTQEIAPEALSQIPLKFDYKKSENGIRRCDDTAEKIDLRPGP